MDRAIVTRDLARILLVGVRLDHFVGDDGRPTTACWESVESGTLSSGEQVLVALAMALLDFKMPAPPTVDRLLQLDRENLTNVAGVLGVLGSMP